MKYVYKTKGTCSQVMNFEVENDTIKNVEIIGGCEGNLKGITNIIKNKTISEVIEAFDGVTCGKRGTSCPDQIAFALKQYKQQ